MFVVTKSFELKVHRLQEAGFQLMIVTHEKGIQYKRIGSGKC